MTASAQPLPPGTPPERQALNDAFWQLVAVVARLRAPDGCPWDRVQTLPSIRPYTLEETYEVLEAIEQDDNAAIAEELGDLLLQVVLYAQIAADEGRFDLIPVIQGISDKLIRRHPHVFGDESADTPEQVTRNWERVKQREKVRTSALDGIPLALPALARAVRLQSKAARVGFEWPDRLKLWDKLDEEIGELEAEIFPNGRPEQGTSGETAPELTPEQKQRVEAELGDVLFVVSNIARRWGINPEEALRHSNTKFARRFQNIEQHFAQLGRKLPDVTLDEMEQVYAEHKRQEVS